MSVEIHVVPIDDLPSIGDAAVTMGVFDGVHRGHRALLDATALTAARTGAKSVALVFHPHPEEVIRPGSQVRRLAPPEENLERIRAAGIDHVVTLRFDDELRARTPEEFLDALSPAIELRAIVMTPESAFGRGRSGTLARIRQLGVERGFEAVAVEPVIDGGSPISSSRVRSAIGAADLDEAGRLLGRPIGLTGTVVTGDGRGRGLGFPTANLAFDYLPALPPLGVYLGRCEAAERNVSAGHPALVSIGVRPTFHDDGRVLVEAYLLDWDGDLYGTQLSVELLTRLRDERRFESVKALVTQMHRDEAEARRLLGIGGVGA